jgi:hypothetical protein
MLWTRPPLKSRHWRCRHPASQLPKAVRLSLFVLVVTDGEHPLAIRLGLKFEMRGNRGSFAVRNAIIRSVKFAPALYFFRA